MTKQQLTNEIKEYMRLLDAARAKNEELRAANSKLHEQYCTIQRENLRLDVELTHVKDILRALHTMGEGIASVAATVGSRAPIKPDWRGPI